MSYSPKPAADVSHEGVVYAGMRIAGFAPGIHPVPVLSIDEEVTVEVD
jgi:hypothetical protein